MATADLARAIGDSRRILLDSSALIAYHSPLETAHPLAAHLFSRMAVEEQPLLGFCSMVSASELLVRPIRAGTRELVMMHRFLTESPNLALLPVDLFVALQAANLRSLTTIRLPDALIVASGLLAGCEVIVSNDERWKRQFAPLYPQFRWLYLGDYLPV
jgi:predicted nucleic acid-binding protein